MDFKPLPTLLDDMATCYGDSPVAHLNVDNSISYAEWQQKSLVVAGALAQIGVSRGSTIGLAFSQRDWLDYLVAYIAVLRLGAVAVSLPSARPPGELGQLSTLVSAGTVISSASNMVADFPGAIVPYSSLVAASAPPALQCELAPNECAEVLFTSGTTGQPKAIWCAHADLVSVPRYKIFDGAIRMQGFYPTGSSAAQGVVQQMLQPTRYWSGRLEVWNFGTFQPRPFLRNVDDSRINALRLTPTIAKLLVEEIAAHPGRYDMSSVSWIKLSAAYSSPTLLDRIKGSFPNAQITNFYGSTESGRVCLRMIYEEDDPASLGRAAPGTEVQIRDAAGHPVPNGSVGEIWLRAIGQRSSRPPGESGLVQPDAWVSGGDLGAMSEDGSVYLFGRLKDVINVGGIKVSPVAVERALESHPSVQAAAAFPVGDDLLGEVVGVAIVPSIQSRVPTTDDLLAYAAALLHKIEIPRTILILEELPLNPVGKVDKRILSSMVQCHPSPPAPGRATRTR